MSSAKVLYAELTPAEFRQRLADAPIAYLPLGTLEWHGEHMPIGADGLQSDGFFQLLASRVGGIVLPMLFLGPDRKRTVEGADLIGMDYCTLPPDDPQRYPDQQMAGSAYWVSGDLFASILDATLSQLSRAGFKTVVAHGHGPSTWAFAESIPAYADRHGLRCFTCQSEGSDTEGLMVDHAATNETSITLALRPDLVKLQNLPADRSIWPVGIHGRDPREFASAEIGRNVLQHQAKRMERILREALTEINRET